MSIASGKSQEFLCIYKICELLLLGALKRKHHLSLLLTELSPNFERAAHGQHMVNPLLKLEAIYSTSVKGCRKILGCQIVEDMLYFPS